MRSSPLHSKPQKEVFASPLVELTQLLDRLEKQISLVRKAHVDSLLKPPPVDEIQSSVLSPTGKFRNFFRRQTKTDETTTLPKMNNPSSEKTEELNSADKETTPNNNLQNLAPSSEKSNVLKANFIDLDDETSFVEYLRRIAELTVTGENYTAAMLKKEEATASRDKWKAHSNILDEDPMEFDISVKDPMERDVHEADYMQMFEIFFERNVLDLIINLLTGAIFQLTDEEKRKTETTDIDADKETKQAESDEQHGAGQLASVSRSLKRSYDETVFLPPIPVATQALQSISILIQNVARATSLYVILSNNRINEIINLPINLYESAEKHRQLQAGQEVSSIGYTTPELLELTTHFVTFLKCLALRMNVETLQFFLKYPTETAGSERPTIPASSSHFSVDLLNGKATEEKSNSHYTDRGSSKDHLHVDFPLYDRALEFCASHQESFVRVTAMNICLNTLRLTTISAEDAPDAGSPKNAASSPGNVLHDTKGLPFRERLAIAYYTCIPSRVERLISPIFTKLAERWNALDDIIREIERTKARCMARKNDAKDKKEKMLPKDRESRQKLTREFKSRAADFQDELLLLEDVFKAGITVLNEQLIERMLATFVYPLMLQPLQMYAQRLSASLENTSFSLSQNPFGTNAMDYSEKLGELAPFAGPAKAALFSLASVFQSLSNLHLLRLLFTALVHPLSPDSSGVPTLRSTLDVATINDQGQRTIRLDLSSSFDNDRETYAFGTLPGNRRVSKSKVDFSMLEDESEACVFVLSPALAEVLESRGLDHTFTTRTRSNPYREALLVFLNTPSDFSDIRELTTCTIDAALTVLNSTFAGDMLFGTSIASFVDNTLEDESTESIDNTQRDTRYSDNNNSASVTFRSTVQENITPKKENKYLRDVVTALCQCVMIASKQLTSSGDWRLDYNEIAGHVILACTRGNVKALNVATEVLDDLWCKGTAFVASRTHCIHNPMSGSSISFDGGPSAAALDYDEQIVDAINNMVFFERVPSNATPVIEDFVQVQGEEGTKSSSHSAPISFQSSFESVCGFVGELLLDEEEAKSTSMTEIEEIQLLRESAIALFKLDAIRNLLKELAANDSVLLKDKMLAGIGISAEGAIVDLKQCCMPNLARRIYAPMSSSLCDTFYGDTLLNETPRAGTAIDLSSKITLPCVCEAPPEISPIFANAGSAVVAEGVTWQSLYLSFSKGFLLVCQPKPNGSGPAESVVIMACLLERLSVQKDDPTPGVAARRLILCHRWFGFTQPSLFLFDAVPQREKFGPFFRAKTFLSSMDIWFEDQKSSDLAYFTIASQIFTAKKLRGHRALDFLVQQSTS